MVGAAKAYAKNKHRSCNHLRRYTNDPYEIHLEAVAEMVEQVGGSPEMVAAAWLHDVVEDTDATFLELERQFGAVITRFVRELTDVSSRGDGNRKARKAKDRWHIEQSSPASKTIKLADLINNARSIIEHDSKFAAVFMNEMRLLLDVLTDGDRHLFAEANKIVDDFFARKEKL